MRYSLIDDFYVENWRTALDLNFDYDRYTNMTHIYYTDIDGTVLEMTQEQSDMWNERLPTLSNELIIKTQTVIIISGRYGIRDEFMPAVGDQLKALAR